ncbi:MAG: DUF6587 family protein [Steroidobacteraceae bacterium]
MNSVLDNVLVGLALLVSACYAVASLAPGGLRQRSLAALSRLTASAPAFLGLKWAARRLSAASISKAAGACGGCDSCQPKPGAVPEVKVPVAKIGRRE